MTPDSGLTAPDLMFVAVRAIAPVAGIPPNNGATMLAIPCPNNSRLELCLSPVIPSATTADSNDSIAPSAAMTSAGVNNVPIFAHVISGNCSLEETAGCPVRSADRFHLSRKKKSRKYSGNNQPHKQHGNTRENSWHENNDKETDDSGQDAISVDHSQMAEKLRHILVEILMTVQIQAEKVAELSSENDDGDTRGKTDGNGPWNEMNQISEFEKTHCHKHDPGHQAGDQQILVTILKYYGKQNRNESPVGPAI